MRRGGGVASAAHTIDVPAARDATRGAGREPRDADARGAIAEPTRPRARVRGAWHMAHGTSWHVAVTCRGTWHIVRDTWHFVRDTWHVMAQDKSWYTVRRCTSDGAAWLVALGELRPADRVETAWLASPCLSPLLPPPVTAGKYAHAEGEATGTLRPRTNLPARYESGGARVEVGPCGGWWAT